MSVRARAAAATLGLLLGYGGACVALAWATAGLRATALASERTGAGVPLDVALGLAAAALAWAVLTWLAGTFALSLAATAFAATGSRLGALAHRVSPALVRRLAAGALGAGIAGSTVWAALPAAAGPPPAPAAASAPDRPADDRPAPDRPADDLRGWTPDRPARGPSVRPSAPVHLVSTPARAGRSVVEEVVVRRGDSLWSIAAHHLGPGASAAEVAAEWPRWHAANRALVGPDPDLIRPGQRLSPPAR